MFKRVISAVLLFLCVALTASCASKTNTLAERYKLKGDISDLIRLCVEAYETHDINGREYYKYALDADMDEFDTAFESVKGELPEFTQSIDGTTLRAYFATEYVYTYVNDSAFNIENAFSVAYSAYFQTDDSTKLIVVFGSVWRALSEQRADTFTDAQKDALCMAVEAHCPPLPAPSVENAEKYRVVVLYHDLITATYDALGKYEKSAERASELSELSSEWVRGVYGS